ncbi:MAG TPA: adenylate/guanylate cyclase domain-containing protein [Methylomirabilota bacterium]|jgi:adenylate cyclase|nr:adenylate/guanylate cyclase domain-containing protein [Methylomirabilota bacterium]
MRFRLPLKVKLSLLITGLVVLAVLLVSFSLIRKQAQTLTEAVTKRGLTIASNLAGGAKSALVSNDDLTLNILVKEAMHDKDVAYVIFADEDGVVRAHSNVTMIGKRLVRPAGLSTPTDHSVIQTYVPEDGAAEIIDFATPLAFSKTPIGTLYVGFSKLAVTHAVNEARNQAILVTAFMIVLGVAGAVTLATLLSRPIFRLVEATHAISSGNLTLEVPVTTHDELGVLTASFNRMVRSLREKEMIKRAFTRYVAREVVEEVLKDPEHLMLTGARREATVLFCDIRGFTSLSERLTPEQVVSLLNEFYTTAIETTFKHDGTLDKFLGDAVMCVFGAPIAHPDHTARAVKTAIEMRMALATLSKRRAMRGLDPFEVGIGVALGEVVAGTVGTEERMEYTVIGDSVNVAARLQGQAKAGSILLSRRTYEAVHDLVEGFSRGPMKVKGKEEEVEVYEVVGFRR